MRWAVLLSALGVLTGCRGNTTAPEPPEKRESPQASAQPAQLAAIPAASITPGAGSDVGPHPAPLRGDEPLAADGFVREGHAYTLTASLRLSDLAGPSRSIEVSQLGLDAAKRATDLRLSIELSATRLRIVFQGRGWVFPPDTELRARADRLGFVVVWPGQTTYRPLPPGSLRALLGERRFDVAPFARAAVEPRGEGPKRASIRTRKIDIKSQAATATIEVGKLENASDGGALLARLLLELVNAPSTASLCGPDEVPLHAEIRWAEARGVLALDVTNVARRTDLPLANLQVPPQGATLTLDPLPTIGLGPMLTPSELAGLRSMDVDVPATAPGVANDALVAINATDELRLLFIDGVPAVWAAPGARGEIRGLHRGRYFLQWRTFLGDHVEAPATHVVPGITHVGDYRP
jgi:hypothetical protein